MKNHTLSSIDILENSISNNSITLVKQGIYNKTKRIIDRHEILARIEYEGHQISPQCFKSAMSERPNLKVDFDLSVLEKGVNTMNRFGGTYSINLFPETLISPDSLQTVSALCRKTNNAVKLIIELLEDGPDYQNYYKDLSKSIALLKNEAPVDIAIDDFPVGKNNILAVRNLKGIDYVKIDRLWLTSFLQYRKVKYGPQIGSKRFIVDFSHILRLIRSEKPDVHFITEGIEDQELFNLVSETQMVEFYQGYYFSKPHNFTMRKAISL